MLGIYNSAGAKWHTTILISRCFTAASEYQLEIHKLENEAGLQIQKEVLVHNSSMVILPILDKDRIVLIRNHRHAVNQDISRLSFPPEPWEKAKTR